MDRRKFSDDGLVEKRGGMCWRQERGGDRGRDGEAKGEKLQQRASMK